MKKVNSELNSSNTPNSDLFISLVKYRIVDKEIIEWKKSQTELEFNL